MNKVNFTNMVADIMRSCKYVHWEDFSEIFVDCINYTIETEI
jgi:hypothetical protein